MSTDALHRELRTFLGCNGNAERYLRRHRPDAHGWCAGCYGARYTAWPCTVAVMAQDAVRRRRPLRVRAMSGVSPDVRQDEGQTVRVVLAPSYHAVRDRSGRFVEREAS